MTPAAVTRVLSLGGGVQSTAVALMALHQDLPAHDVAIFADTGDEPAPVYRHVEWLARQLEASGVQVVIARPPTDIVSDLLRMERGGAQWANPPLFTEGQLARTPTPPTLPLDLPNERVLVEVNGQLRRQCTRTYKIEVIEREVSRLIGRPKGGRWPTEVAVEQVIGISWDEAQRQTVNPIAAIRNVYPLCERRITRADCLTWLRRHGYPEPPKSACRVCPYRSNAEWRWLREQDPEGFEHACRVDDHIRDAGHPRGVLSRLYLHRSRTPLREVDLTAADDGQEHLMGVAAEECSGMCGA